MKLHRYFFPVYLTLVTCFAMKVSACEAETDFDKIVNTRYGPSLHNGSEEKEFSVIKFTLSSETNYLTYKLCKWLRAPDCAIIKLNIVNERARLYAGYPEYRKKSKHPPYVQLNNIFAALKTNKSIRKLDLSENYFTKAQWGEARASLAENETIEELVLDHCFIINEDVVSVDEQGLSYFCDSELSIALGVADIIQKNNHLKKISLKCTLFNENKSFETIIAALHNSSVTSVDLRHTILRPESCKVLMNLLEAKKDFVLFDLRGSLWSGFGSLNYQSYEIYKRIGMTLEHQENEASLKLSPTLSLAEYKDYNPIAAFCKDVRPLLFSALFISYYGYRLSSYENDYNIWVELLRFMGFVAAMIV